MAKEVKAKAGVKDAHKYMPHMNRQHGITTMVNSSLGISEREACHAASHSNVSSQHPCQHPDARSEAN
jgi:hypothetical protein